MTANEINHMLQVYILVLSIAGSIIVLLLAVIGYFLKQLASAFKKLQETLQSFREEYIATKENVSSINLRCAKRENLVDKRLDDHSDRLDRHEIAIAKMQVKTSQL
jgi:predicted PurR-regulated permease PerM